MSTTHKLVIAIDGPAGSGKSTIAARLAKKLGYVNLESGAMYRALALKAMEQTVSLDDGEALRKLAESTVIHLEPRGEGNRDAAAVTSAWRIRCDTSRPSSSTRLPSPRGSRWITVLSASFRSE